MCQCGTQPADRWLVAIAKPSLHMTMAHLCSGDVNVTLSCCVYNDKMFQKDTMISANAYRCEILVCEEKVEDTIC